MSKFCHACGVSLDDDAVFCNVCGSQQQSADNMQPQGQFGQPGQFGQSQNRGQSGLDMNNVIKSAESMAQQAGEAVKKTFSDVSLDSIKSGMNINDIKNVAKTKNKNTIIGLAACAAALILLVTIISLAIPKPYKKPIDNLFTAIEKCDGKKLEAALPEFVNDLNDNKSKELTDYYEDMLELLHDELEDKYGDNVRFSVSYVKAKKLDKSDLRHEENRIKVSYNEDVDITAGYQVKIKATVKGKDDKDTGKGKISVYKIDGKWCVENLDDASIF